MLVDFDGTIAAVDTTDLLLERFADPDWERIEADWKAGRIGSRECMLGQIDLIRASPEALDRFIDEVEIDPGFPAFVTLCRERGLGLTVVSDGLDRTVARVLARHGLGIPFRANHLAWRGGDRWRLEFPHARGNCRSLAGTCKCAIAGRVAGALTIVVGDGRSDFCVAAAADLVLAKGALARHAAATGLAHLPIRSFAEATPLLGRWLDEAQRDAARYGSSSTRGR